MLWSAVANVAKPLSLRSDSWNPQQERVHHWGRTNGNQGFALENLKPRETLSKVNVEFVPSDGFTCFFLLILIT